MRMGVGTRIVFTVFLIAIIGVCVFLVCAALGVIPAVDVDALVYGMTNSDYRYIWVVCAIVVAVVALILMFFGTKKVEPSSVLLAETADGSVSVTLEAIDELARRYVNDIYGIVIQRTQVRPTGERTVRIDLYLSVKQEVEMPQTTKDVTEGMKTYVEKYSGVTVSYVGIKILPLKQNQPPVR